MNYHLMKRHAIHAAQAAHQIRRSIPTLVCVLAGAVCACAEEPLVDWWNGKHASGNWMGMREALEDRGVIVTGNWKGTFYGIVDGGVARRGAFDEELHFHLKLDFERMLGLRGLSAYGSVRWR